MAFTEDLSAFFSTDEFATSATLDGAAVTGVFDAAHAVATVGDAGYASTAPAFTLPTADVPASPVGKSFVHATVSYTVAEHHPDGTGVSVLLLERAS